MSQTTRGTNAYGAAAEGGGEGRRRLDGRRIARGLATVLAVGGLTFATSEIALRQLLGVAPLSEARDIYRAHPRWGWHHEPYAVDDFVKLGTKQRIEIGPGGTRSQPIPYERRPGTLRILVLGDSVVAGLEVPAEALWTRVAERALREDGIEAEVINAGVRGWGTDQSLLYLQDEGVRYAPDLVLYYWNANDVDDNATVHRPFRIYGKPYFDLDAEGQLVLRGVPVPEYPYASNIRVGEDGAPVELPVAAHLPAAMWVRDRLVMTTAFATGLVHVAAALPQITQTVLGLGRYADFQDGPKALDRSQRIFRVTAAMILEMDRIAASHGARFRMLGARGEWPEALLEETQVASLGELPHFDARVEDGKRLYVPMDTHWNELGHDAYGSALAERIATTGLIAARTP